MAASTRRTDPYNDKRSYVVKDLIWKDHIAKIEIAQKSHHEKWGFLNDLQPETNAYDPKRSPRALLARARPPAETDLKVNEEKYPAQTITVAPSPRPIPSTTSNFIGWRTSDKQCTLEKFGPYARGQGSLHKKFKWPIEGFE